ncbi:enolase-phosphatase E1 [Condylostylus longicornis]|uniref:enolase-phosphatase E1 n=1 Tax=Condylostylus longicornis TaxID=2530218 RepID=UPI00244DA36F|nr:enolase-phosphatase E1 [Condylostylus longicornis]
MENIEAEAVICDIEGTTTSISFVKDELFPFSKKNVLNFLTQNCDNSEVKLIFNELQHLPDYKGKFYEDVDSTSISEIAAFAIQLIDEDKKLGPLKKLQGLIWQEGFDQGLLKGHIYSDVLPAFKTWTENQIKIFIYSSGSVQSQKLLFGNSVEGNLLSYISAYFDTTVGYKQEPQSYENILSNINLPAEKVVFFTDVVQEAEAATNAGIKAVLLERPGNSPFTEKSRSSFIVIKSFDEIIIKK